MKDMDGNNVVVGDILLEIGRGQEWDGKNTFYSMCLWEMPKKYDGHGYGYNIDGSRYKWAWVHLNSSIKIDKDSVSKDFLFSFYHRMSDIKTHLKKGTLFELIDSSDWRRKTIKKEDVQEYDETDKIVLSSKKDIYDNVDILMNSKFINYKIMKKVLDLFNISEATGGKNGEIGIAMMHNISNYNSILYHVKYRGESY